MNDFAENRNISIPSYFYISGFSGIPHMRYYYIFLSFVYIISFLGNSCLMFVIIIDRNLHTAKYIAVFNLSLSDICESTAVIPQLLDTFLFRNQLIPYRLCLYNMFSVFVSISTQSLTLAVLSFDRLVAICLPLRYHMIVTFRSMLVIIGLTWALTLLMVMTATIFISRLSFCKVIVTVNSFYCDHGPIYRSACSNNFPSSVIGSLYPIVILGLPVFFIIFSYTCIAVTLFRVTTPQDRQRATKTCTAHLILVAVFYLPITITYSLASIINTNTRIINLSLTSALPPMLNPIIYTFKTEEFMVSVKKLLKRKIIFPYLK
ncbi:odorant receptor 110-2 isoform X1 [Danio rerio]|uniref:Odorant receptor n=1 Tax=Danio rerio TaxID=7955 RepID=Q2PRK4_DANRE|nr:odorant receptor 110-2 [Danio rerio]XP_005169209.1 odorant receptor, family D, subfamily 110, member 2 isoform X1 [Danio rerio]ABC43263.1 odorant receptor [Danio rerio]|eukprot:NP_001121883.1 odorant receptor, family D, subfamily 110, member 2 [Danio rerio]